jgi:nicotinamide phosphoribosyltransferase
MVFNENNIILMTDSYKVSHWKQYPPKTEFVYSYFESRGGKFTGSVFFGLQYLLKKYFVGQVVTQEKIDEAKNVFNPHFDQEDMYNISGWQYILDKYDGYLPVKIKAVPEGSVTPIKNVLITVENTDPNCYWLTNYIETLLVQTWYPITISTNSRECKKLINHYLEETGDPSGLSFKLHDFGYRGVSSNETAMIGGASHLVNFLGTDTLAGIVMANNYYNAGICGFSVPASEHSTITSWGKDNEVDAMRNMLEQYPTGLVACVSDSFDIYNACRKIWGEQLKDQILHRDGTLVIRPDSGSPTEVIPKLLFILWDKFGGTINEKGYRVLDSHVQLIQGDGINYEMLGKILEVVKENGFSVDNIAFGSGGGLLQQFNRDTMSFAFKCSYIIIDGKGYDVYKDPVTSKSKMSKKGRLKLINDNGTIKTVNENQPGKDLLVTVFENGELLVEYNFDEIRERAKL